ncbi:hypothetical protein [Streptomyces sp. NPDC018045]|uniref:hypothetical protein n=1 Tax=Streptomyces sp. NPDC018045 TaxID=3365037 RepID=UPI0037A113C3
MGRIVPAANASVPMSRWSEERCAELAGLVGLAELVGPAGLVGPAREGAGELSVRPGHRGRP